MVIINENCRLCKSCVEVCPNQIFTVNENHVVVKPERTHLCFACGHCMAVCAHNAVMVKGLHLERDFFDLPCSPDSSEAFRCLLQTRRSVRVFKNTPVAEEMLQMIAEAVSFSPPSFPPVKTELVIINGREKLEAVLPEMVAMYEKMVKGLSNPIAKTFVKKSMGPEKYKIVKNHLLPLLSVKLPYMLAGTEDSIFRGAPACMLFHANREADNAVPDIYIAVGFAILAAHSLGLGATVVDLIAPAVERTPALRAMFSIPEGNKVVAAVILGHPKYRFKKGIKRQLKSVVYM